MTRTAGASGRDGIRYSGLATTSAKGCVCAVVLLAIAWGSRVVVEMRWIGLCAHGSIDYGTGHDDDDLKGRYEAKEGESKEVITM